VPIIDPDARKQAEAQQQAIVEAKIQSLVAGFFTQNVDLDIEDDEQFEAAATQTLERSFDAAVIFARQVLGVNLQRNPPQAEQQAAAEERMSNPPQPIIEG
jgi:hypothetical protein